MQGKESAEICSCRSGRALTDLRVIMQAKGKMLTIHTMGHKITSREKSFSLENDSSFSDHSFELFPPPFFFSFFGSNKLNSLNIM